MSFWIYINKTKVNLRVLSFPFSVYWNSASLNWVMFSLLHKLENLLMHVSPSLEHFHSISYLASTEQVAFSSVMPCAEYECCHSLNSWKSEIFTIPAMTRVFWIPPGLDGDSFKSLGVIISYDDYRLTQVSTYLFIPVNLFITMWSYVDYVGLHYKNLGINLR